jgi:hypothetical protein
MQACWTVTVNRAATDIIPTTTHPSETPATAPAASTAEAQVSAWLNQLGG